MREAGGCRGFGFAAGMVCCACAEFCLSVWSALGRIFIQPLMFRSIRSIRSAVPWARLALTPPFRCRCAVPGRPEAVPTPGRFLVLADLASGLCTRSRCACLRVLLRPGALRATLSNVPCSRRGSAVHGARAGQAATAGPAPGRSQSARRPPGRPSLEQLLLLGSGLGPSLLLELDSGSRLWALLGGGRPRLRSWLRP